MALLLRYVGHLPGASMSYFTGASVTLVPGQTFAVPEGGMVLGRRINVDLRVASSMVAPKHLRLTPVESGLELQDLGSTNGTRVNGASVMRARVHAGDRFTLAEAFEFEVVEV